MPTTTYMQCRQLVPSGERSQAKACIFQNRCHLSHRFSHWVCETLVVESTDVGAACSHFPSPLSVSDLQATIMEHSCRLPALTSRKSWASKRCYFQKAHNFSDVLLTKKIHNKIKITKKWPFQMARNFRDSTLP